MKKKLHWTQTPEGRELMRRRMKKMWKSGDFKGSTKKRTPRRKISLKETNLDGTQVSETQVAYVCGQVEQILTGFAARNGLSFSALANRVGTVLLSAAGG